LSIMLAALAAPAIARMATAANSVFFIIRFSLN
jgi:hypothetical protein